MRTVFVKFIILLSVFLFIADTAYAGQQTIALKQGFNFISFTVNPDVNAAGLKQQNSVISEIYLYSAAAGSFLSTLDGSLVSLSAGKGYIISAGSAASITVNGTAVSAIGNISLKSGFNLIGISKTISSLKFSELILNNSSIKGIYKWSSAAGSFISVVKSSTGNIYQIDGVDPVLSSEQSYFINIDSDSSLSYDNGYFAFNSAASADEEAIRNIYTQYTAGVKAKNIAAILALYSDNFLHMDGNGSKTKAILQSEFSSSSFASAEGTDLHVISMKVTASSAIVAYYRKMVFDGTVEEDGNVTSSGESYLAKENGKWLIVGNQKQWALSGFTAHFPNNYQVEMYVDDPQNKISSVTMSGPGVTSSNSSLIHGFYSWMPTRWAPNPMPNFGASKPSASLIYNFTITSNNVVYNETLDLGNNFIDEAPALISPANNSTVSSKPTFTWNPVSFSNASYHVEVSKTDYSRVWEGGGDSSATSSTYTGTLAPGKYIWNVATKKQGSEDVSFTDYFTFTVQ